MTTPHMFTIAISLKLGRVSNLPTVWSNTLAATILAGGTALDWRICILLFAMTLAYSAGMFLNDAFDRDIDAIERPERPIPAGEASAVSVFIVGYTMLLMSIFLVAMVALAEGGNTRAIIAVFALAGAIILYNLWHKNNPLSPLLMGLCRMLVYVTAGWSLGTIENNGLPVNLYFTSLLLFAYLTGLTYTAKQETIGQVSNLWPLLLLFAPVVFGFYMAMAGNQALWIPTLVLSVWTIYALWLIHRRQPGDIQRAVVSMIAGISLLDALFIASVPDHSQWSILAIAAFLLTLYLQRHIAGS
ncbi:MAG: UbiA family prenyltransferase [Granulosicoccus sp.]